MRLVLTFALIAAVVAAAPTPAQAKKKKKVYSAQYVIPFTCGDNPADLGRALPGDYAIAVDIRSATAEASVDEQVMLTFPPGGQMPAFSSDVVTQIIPAGSAIQISCDELLGAAFIYQSPPPATTYVQGLLVLTSRTPLQVFATRTAQGPAGGLSMQTDPIAPSSVPFQAPSEEKVEICHVPPGNPGNSHELKIGASAWPAHQAHGDTLGDCPDDDDDDDDEIEDD